MLFNSYPFIFLFLPITLCGFFLVGRIGNLKIAIAWLVLASLFFYGWWNPAYLGLFVFSILFNYVIGVALIRGVHHRLARQCFLAFGLGINLLLLGYFKYANFFLQNFNNFTGSNFELEAILLPLAISFYTFQLMAYLIDSYRGEIKDSNFVRYCLFITFFPQLIAGPIVHHKDVIPQFSRKLFERFSSQDLAVGLTIFSAGLFKKVVLADGVAPYATPIFDAAANGASIGLMAGWCGALAYTLQLYFDFSGYSDMAIGSARLFGVKLPLNFNSPYKAVDISDFWRRWHITLSNFLRDYLYIPLGGNRKGEVRRQVNLMTTMLLGGLWHGAGWTFVFWGGLHGAYLIGHRQWQVLRRSGDGQPGQPSRWGLLIGQAITFLAVVISWVFFRAKTMGAALAILQGMVGLNGLSSPDGANGLLQNVDGYAFAWIGILLLVVWLAPNVQEWLACFEPALGYGNTTDPAPQGRLGYFWKGWRWEPTKTFAAISSAMLLLSILLLSRPAEFLYFQF